MGLIRCHGKKDSTIRFCVDYSQINAVAMKDSYPFTRIDDVLDQLAGNDWFTTLDLKSGNWQVRLSPNDKKRLLFPLVMVSGNLM